MHRLVGRAAGCPLQCLHNAAPLALHYRCSVVHVHVLLLSAVALAAHLLLVELQLGIRKGRSRSLEVLLDPVTAVED